MAELHKCGHESCNCLTTERYCSEPCSMRTETLEMTCQCRHEECANGLQEARRDIWNEPAQQN